MEKAVLIELLPTGVKMTTEKLLGGAFHKKIDEVSDIIIDKLNLSVDKTKSK